MEAIIAALAIFTLSCSATFFFIWYKARQLRDALEGQDGHRLMVIFCRIFLITGIFLVLTSLRQVLIVVNEEETIIFRIAVALVSTIAMIGVFGWSLLAIKALIDEGKTTHTHEDKSPN